jgi:hypothetical protein
MFASPVFSSAAVGRPFIFPGTVYPATPSPSNDVEEAETSAGGTTNAAARIPPAGVLPSRLGLLKKLASAITPASHLHVRPAPDMVSCGIRELDALTGGLPRGCLTEICGPASSGKTSILLSALASATRRGEVCALVDASDALHPASAATAGIQLERLLWIRCATINSPRRHGGAEKFNAKSMTSKGSPFLEKGNVDSREQKVLESQLEQVLKVTDLLLQSNGFGMIALDLSDIPARSARRIPLASWFRFRRAVEHTPTVLLIMEQQPIAGSCSSVLIRARGKQPASFSDQHAANLLSHAQLLDELEINAEVLRSRLDRKSPQSATTGFSSRAAWAS